jgi:HEAT repeat protein
VADATAAPALAALLAKIPPGEEREAAIRAVARSCQQIENPERRAEPVLAELRRAGPAARPALLPALGRIGGPQALAVVHEAIQDRDRQVRDAAVRALADWPDASVADELLHLARTAELPTHRIWTLRGFARVVAREGPQQPQKTSEQLREAMQLAERMEDKQLILQRLTAARVPDALTLALSCVDNQELQAEAIDSTVSLAEAMKDSHPAEARAALERILKVTSDPELQLYIAKLLWNMQLKGH